MLKYMKENKLLWVFYLLLVPCATISSSLYSLSLTPLLNVVYTKNISDFITYAVWVSIFAALDLITHYFHKICREKLRVYYVAGLKRDIVEALLKKSIVDFNTYSVSQYTSIINRDVDKMNRCYFDALCGIYRVSICFVVNLGLVFWMNPIVAILNIFISLMSVFLPRLFEKKMLENQEKSSTNSEKYYGLLKDYLSGFTTIKLFHIQQSIKDKIERSNRELETSNFVSIATNYSVSWISMLCTQIAYILTIVIGIGCTIKGWMTIGSVISISQLMGGIVVPIQEMPEHLANYRSVQGIRKKIEEIMKSKQEEVEKEEVCFGESGDIQVWNISYAYDTRDSLLEDISFTIEANKKYVLIGGSGSGKSTLAKLLMRFYSCKNGKITFGGRDIREYPDKQFYRMVTYLAQDIFLFDDTLLSNITLYRSYAEEEIARAVKLSGLQGLIERLPDGLQTIIEGNGMNFSGGEKQRIGIARALLSGAKFIVFDEITANLDTELSATIEDTIMNLPATSVLYITHKWSRTLFEKSDAILMLKKGRLVKLESYEQLLEE